jgi:hypothetical protein
MGALTFAEAVKYAIWQRIMNLGALSDEITKNEGVRIPDKWRCMSYSKNEVLKLTN